MFEERCDFLDRKVERHIPRRTRHRHSIPSWKTFTTSNLINKPRTQRKLLLMKSISYGKMQVAKLQNNVLEAAEIGKTSYKEKEMSTRDTNAKLKLSKV